MLAPAGVDRARCKAQSGRAALAATDSSKGKDAWYGTEAGRSPCLGGQAGFAAEGPTSTSPSMGVCSPVHCDLSVELPFAGRVKCPGVMDRSGT